MPAQIATFLPGLGHRGFEDFHGIWIVTQNIIKIICVLRFGSHRLFNGYVSSLTLPALLDQFRVALPKFADNLRLVCLWLVFGLTRIHLASALLPAVFAALLTGLGAAPLATGCLAYALI